MTNITISELESTVLSDDLCTIVEGSESTKKTSLGELKSFIVEGKQDTLIAGQNVTIEDNVISVNVEGGNGESNYKGEYSDEETYTKGDIVVDSSNRFYICIKDSTTGVATNNILTWTQITNDGFVKYSETSADEELFLGLIISSVDGSGYSGVMKFSDNAPKVNAATGELVGYATTQQMTNELSTKQDRLIPGDGITIEDNVISSVGGGSSGTTITMRDWSN